MVVIDWTEFTAIATGALALLTLALAVIAVAGSIYAKRSIEADLQISREATAAAQAMTSEQIESTYRPLLIDVTQTAPATATWTRTTNRCSASLVGMRSGGTGDVSTSGSPAADASLSPFPCGTSVRDRRSSTPRASASLETASSVRRSAARFTANAGPPARRRGSWRRTLWRRRAIRDGYKC